MLQYASQLKPLAQLSRDPAKGPPLAHDLIIMDSVRFAIVSHPRAVGDPIIIVDMTQAKKERNDIVAKNPVRGNRNVAMQG
ncbi:hypothetical protein VTO42DRAFT_8222 [Malbranchea cinnamomea]